MAATRIGLVGCGEWGKFILRDLLSLGCDVPVVARSAESVERARAAGASRIVGRVAELGEVDGIVVASTTFSHFDVLCEVIERFPTAVIFCEKPMTPDLRQASELVRLAGGRLFVMDKWRYHTGVLELARIARSGELGPVVGLRSGRVQWGHSHSDVDSIWILLPHDLAIALEVLGRVPMPVAARADCMDGHCYGLFGLLGDSPWMEVEISGRRLNVQREVQLYCRDGVAVLADGYSKSIQIARSRLDMPMSRPTIEDRPIAEGMPLLEELRAFVAYVRGEGPAPKSSAAEGLEIVRTIEALRRMAGV